jgi:hypothetical protein
MFRCLASLSSLCLVKCFMFRSFTEILKLGIIHQLMNPKILTFQISNLEHLNP